MTEKTTSSLRDTPKQPSGQALPGSPPAAGNGPGDDSYSLRDHTETTTPPFYIENDSPPAAGNEGANKGRVMEADNRKDDGRLSPPAAVDLLQQAAALTALWQQYQASAQQYQANILERAWKLWVEFDTADDFMAFAHHHLTVMPLAIRRKLPQMVKTWAIAREQRELRELAMARPNSAMKLISQLVDAGVADDDGVDNAEVTRLLAMKPRPRNKALNALIEQANGMAVAAPVANRVENVVALAKPTAGQAEQIYAIRRLVNDVCKTLDEDCVQRINRTQRHALVAAIDVTIERLEVLNGRLLDRLSAAELAGDFDES